METPIRILLVEDSEDDAILLTEMLRSGGFAPSTRRVMDRDALQAALGQGPWDIVLSDYAMPDFDGLTAYRLLRQHDPDTPFIFVSGHIGEERAVEAMQHGVSDYISKDRLARLVPAVERELRDAQGRRQRREMEAALRASEERLRRLTQNAPDIIYEYTLQPRPHFTFVSPAVEGITGYTAEEHYADPELWLKLTHEDDRAALTAWLRQGYPLPSQSEVLRWRHRDGRLRWVEQRLVPIRVEGLVVAVEGIVRDITDRKELEAQFLAAQRMEAIGRLAGGIAHDFNNMLTVIGSYCSLLRHHVAGDDAGLTSLQRIESATERAASLVRQLLAFGRRQPRELAVLDFSALLDDFAPMLRRMIGEDIRVRIDCEAGLLALRADRSQLEQVLMNLVVNARDAMPDGGQLTLAAAAVTLPSAAAGPATALPPGRYVVLRAADTGVGMSDEVRTRIFDPFFTTKEVGKGTGLGLSTVYGIVRQMDGAVQVQSAPGAGTTFAIYLPAAVGAPRPAPAPQAGQERGGSGHILLVEDEEAVREAAQRILASHGYTIRAASNAAEALQILAGAERVVDLLLTDLVMPNMNGVELARRAREQIPHLKVLFTTGYTEAALPEPGSGPGRTGVLLKPFGSQALLRKVREMLAGDN
jgi:hypothetical protein